MENPENGKEAHVNFSWTENRYLKIFLRPLQKNNTFIQFLMLFSKMHRIWNETYEIFPLLFFA